MACGLRKINGQYMPYGSGRDFFFIGDFEYKHGRRTPDCNIRWAEEQKGCIAPKRRPRGQPQEMAMTKSLSSMWQPAASSSNEGVSSPKLGGSQTKIPASLLANSMPPAVMERLRRQQSEPTCNDMLRKGSKGEAHVNRWKDANSSKRDRKATRCLRKGGPKDTSAAPTGPAQSCYSELGKIHELGLDWQLSDYGAPEKHRYHSSFGKVVPPPKDPNHPLAKVDEHMKEFPGWQKHPGEQAKKFYLNALAECEVPLDKPLNKNAKCAGEEEWGYPSKHNHFGGSSLKLYAPKDINREQVEKPAAWKPPEWGQPDKHRFHQPPLWAPKDAQGVSRVPPGTTGIMHNCEIPHNYQKPEMDTMVKHRTFKCKSLYM